MTQPAPPPPPLQASDPARLTDGQIVPRYVPPRATTVSSFHVDLINAPTAIAQLSTAADELQALRKEALALGNVSPPARDSVSVDAARLLGTAAIGGSGSLIQALDAGLAQIDEFARSLRRDLEAYREVETRNIHGLAPDERS